MEDIYKVWDIIKDRTKSEYDITNAAYRTFIDPLIIDSVKDDNVKIIIPFDEDEGIGIDYYRKRYKTPLEVAIEEVTEKRYKL